MLLNRYATIVRKRFSKIKMRIARIADYYNKEKKKSKSKLDQLKSCTSIVRKLRDDLTEK